MMLNKTPLELEVVNNPRYLQPIKIVKHTLK